MNRKKRVRVGFIKRKGPCKCPKGDLCPRPNANACKRRAERFAQRERLRNE